MKKNSFTYEELISCGNGELFGPGNAKLPLPPMLMFDRITEINDNGGEFKKGLIKARDMLKFIPNIKMDVVERCAGHGGTFGVMKETQDLAVKVGRPTARQIKNKNNKYMASDCPLAGKHLKQLETDTNISNDEALHPIELMAKSYKL